MQELLPKRFGKYSLRLHPSSPRQDAAGALCTAVVRATVVGDGNAARSQLRAAGLLALSGSVGALGERSPDATRQRNSSRTVSGNAPAIL